MSDFLDRLGGVDVGGGNLILAIDGEPHWAHDTADGDYCELAGLPDHDVREFGTDQVDIGGSLGCRRCGRHGFVRDGQWQEAAPLRTGGAA